MLPPQRLLVVFGGALLISVLLAAAALQRPEGQPVAAALGDTTAIPVTPTAIAPAPPLTATATGSAPSITTSPTPSTRPAASTSTSFPAPTRHPPSFDFAQDRPATREVPALSAGGHLPPPTPDAQARGRVVTVPILMLHYVQPLPEGAGPIRQGLTLSPEQFEARLRFLADRGYQSVSLYDLQYALALGYSLPPRPVIFSFDDGYAGVYTYAFPLMQTYGFTGTVFLLTDPIDQGNPAYLSWAQAEALAEAGWDLEPHTKDHPDLRDKPRGYLIYQVLGSMQTVQVHTGRQARFFSYPSGEYDDEVIGILKEIGFWGAVTTHYGYVHRLRDAYTLARVRVSGTDSLAQFALRLGLTP